MGFDIEIGMADKRDERNAPEGGHESTDTPTWVIGPLGQRLTLEQLPPPGFRHWVPRHKAEVVAAVSGGLLTIDDALRRYNMTIEEYAGWERAVNRFGLPGLRVTLTDRYRDIQGREQKF